MWRFIIEFILQLTIEIIKLWWPYIVAFLLALSSCVHNLPTVLPIGM